MKVRTFVIAFVVIAAVLLVGGIYASATSAPPEREAPAATVSVDSGEAFIVRKGSKQWEVVGAPVGLDVGDRVRTGAGSSATMEFFDQSTARLDENTEIEVQALSADPDNFTSQRVDFAVVAGRVWSRIIKFFDADSSYSVETSTLVATVRGTAFVVDAREENPRVWVAENSVGVSLVRPSETPGGRRTLSPPTLVGEGEEAQREISPATFAVVPDRVRVRKMLGDARTNSFAVDQLRKDESFFSRARDARERRLRRYAPGALPGSPGYPLKVLGERLRLALTTDPEARRDLRLRYADRRFAEAVLLARAGRREQTEKILRKYYRDFADEMRGIDPRSAAIDRELAVRRWRKIRGRLREHQDLIRNLALENSLREFLADRPLRDPEVAGLGVTDLVTRLDESYAELPKPADEPLYEPRTIEAAPATSTIEEAPQPAGQPAANTNQPTNTNAPAEVSIVSLAVTGTRSIMSYPDSQQFRAIATYSDNSTKDVTDLSAWILEGDPVGTLSRGLLTTSAQGTASVVSLFGGQRGTYQVRVQPPAIAVLEQLAVRCPLSTIKGGEGEQCTATASYSDGSTRDVTNGASWSVTNTTIGRVSATGYFTSNASPFGTTSVAAGYAEGDIMRSGSFSVTTIQ